MARVTRNFAANMAGTAWGTLVGLVAVPLYLRLIGAEGYGLIGFYAVLVALLSMLDAGFSAAAARELARTEGEEGDARARVAQTVRMLERAFLAVGAACGVLVIALAPWAATRWLNLHDIGIEEGTRAVRLMGVSLILQFPLALYNGCLLGMQRHGWMNAVNAIAATARAVGGILVLWAISPTADAFFAWQAVVALGTFVATRALVRRLLPRGASGTGVELARLRELGRFAAGMGGINVLGLALTQMDKVVLSFLLPLREFGYYALAWTLASLVYRISFALYNTVLPRMTELLARGDAGAFRSIFLSSGESMAALVVPFSLFLVVFASEIVGLWTGDPQAASADRWVLALLSLGTMASAIMQVPFAAQVAGGRVRPLFLMNLGAVAAVAPLMVFLTSRAGITGAAASWAILHVPLFGVMMRLAGTQLGGATVVRWSVESLARPVALSALVLLAAKALVSPLELRGASLFVALAAAGIACELAAVAASPFVRGRVRAIAAAARARGPAPVTVSSEPAKPE
jgi:O-antigen/teichoic acid export membrane protein